MLYDIIVLINVACYRSIKLLPDQRLMKGAWKSGYLGPQSFEIPLLLIVISFSLTPPHKLLHPVTRQSKHDSPLVSLLGHQKRYCFSDSGVNRISFLLPHPRTEVRAQRSSL